MKKMRYLNILVIVGIVCFGIWLNENPPFTNESPANITIIQDKDTVYNLKNLETDQFEYYLKKEPKEIIFIENGNQVILYNHENGDPENWYSVIVEYTNPINPKVKAHHFY